MNKEARTKQMNYIVQYRIWLYDPTCFCLTIRNKKIMKKDYIVLFIILYRTIPKENE